MVRLFKIEHSSRINYGYYLQHEYEALTLAEANSGLHREFRRDSIVIFDRGSPNNQCELTVRCRLTLRDVAPELPAPSNIRSGARSRRLRCCATTLAPLDRL